MVRSSAAAGAWWPAAVIVAGVIIIVMWPALRPVTPGAARLRRGRQAVLATTARAGLDAAQIALGALALWELRRYSAAPRLSGGTLGIDPVLAVAPAVALAGISLLPLRILPAAARLLDGLSGRGRRLAGGALAAPSVFTPTRQDRPGWPDAGGILDPEPTSPTSSSTSSARTASPLALRESNGKLSATAC